MKKIIFLLTLFLGLAVAAQSQKDIYYQAKIATLEKKVDSLIKENQYDAIKYKDTEHQEVVSKVNEFYDSAWNKLVILLGILAVGTPLIIQWMQQRNFKNSEKRIFDELGVMFQEKLVILKGESDLELLKLNEAFEKKINALSDQNAQQMTDLETQFMDITKQIKSEYKKSSARIQSNFWLHVGYLKIEANNVVEGLSYLIIAYMYSQLGDWADDNKILKHLNRIHSELLKLKSKDEASAVFERIGTVVNVPYEKFRKNLLKRPEPLMETCKKIVDKLDQLLLENS